jgi:hypothetical protein
MGLRARESPELQCPGALAAEASVLLVPAREREAQLQVAVAAAALAQVEPDVPAIVLVRRPASDFSHAGRDLAHERWMGRAPCWKRNRWRAAGAGQRRADERSPRPTPPHGARIPNAAARRRWRCTTQFTTARHATTAPSALRVAPTRPMDAEPDRDPVVSPDATK